MGWGPCGCAESGGPSNVAVPNPLPGPGDTAPAEPVPQAPPPNNPMPATPTPEEVALPAVPDDGPTAPADGTQPAQPSRSDVTRVLGGLSGQVTACGNGESGMALVRMTINGSTGRVATVEVSGSVEGTPAGNCIAGVMRGARFPLFSSDTFRVAYPYRL